jgi:hypothetical protein
MRVADADDRSIVPLGYTVQQAHPTGVWDEPADLRFADQGIVNRF